MLLQTISTRIEIKTVVMYAITQVQGPARPKKPTTHYVNHKAVQIARVNTAERGARFASTVTSQHVLTYLFSNTLVNENSKKFIVWR